MIVEITDRTLDAARLVADVPRPGNGGICTFHGVVRDNCDGRAVVKLGYEAYESMALARAIGLPQEVLEEAGRSNGQITELMLSYLAGHKLPEEARHSEGFQALMRNHMKIAEKDLSWALELARKSGVSLPVGSLVSQSMARLYGVDDAGRR